MFVDAVGTGYSRPVGKATIKNFAGTDQDVQAFSKFIQRYVEREPPLEFAEVPVRRIVRHHAFGRAGRRARKRRYDRATA